MPLNSPPTPPALAIRAVSRTDVGMRRAANQDALAIVPEPTNGLISGDAVLMVADGMGAHAAGELASKMAVDTVPHAYLKACGNSAPDALRQAICEANEKINDKGASSPDFQGMGTTCSCLILAQGSVLVGHVGDSRVYRLRQGELAQLTFDHSLVWEMAAASKVPEDQVPSCIPKNVITRSLGPHEEVNVDLEGPETLQEGDVFLLCSDGLTGVVDDPLAASLLATLEPAEAADALINLANLGGGPDNISVIVAKVERSNGSESGNGSSVNAGRSPQSHQRRAWGGIAAAACALAGAVAFVQSHFAAGISSAVGLLVSIAYAFSKQPTAEPLPTATLPSGPYGKGPYRHCECGDHSVAAGELREMVRQLAALQPESDSSEPGKDTVQSDGSSLSHQAVPAVNEQFQIDWGPFAEAQQSADAAFDAGDFAGAVVAYARIVRSVMRSLREDDGTHRYKVGNEVFS